MRVFVLLISAIGFTSLSDATDLFNGDILHSEKCTGCHDSAIYIRENRKVQTLPRLSSQVRFCKDNLGIAWFDDEVEDVIGYLNSNYYHFE